MILDAHSHVHDPLDAHLSALDAAGFALAMRELDRALTAHPYRFLGFGSVPLGRPDAETAARVEREVTVRGLYGIGELTPPPGRLALVEPVVRAARDHAGLPVVIPRLRAHHRRGPAHTRRPGGPLPEGPAGDQPTGRSPLDGGDRTGPGHPQSPPRRGTRAGEVRDRVLGGNLAELLGLG